MPFGRAQGIRWMSALRRPERSGDNHENCYLLKIYPFSLVVPLGALTYIWTQIISKVLLGEPGSVRKSVGIGLILVVVTVVAWSY